MIHHQLTVTVTLIALVGFCTGCLEKSEGSSDAGTNTNVYRDGGADAAPGPDAAPVECDLDDLVAQLGCDTGERCTLLSTTEIGCHTAGIFSAYESCSSTTLPEGDCDLGTSCSDVHDPGTPACLPFCLEKFEPCPGAGMCVLESGYDGVFFCSIGNDCEPTDASGIPTCDNGAGCYFSTEDHTYCIENGGNKLIGDSCSDLECSPGLVCANSAEGYSCQKLCSLNPADCPDASCILQFGVYGTCD